MLEVEYCNPNKPVKIPSYTHKFSVIDYNKRTLSITFKVPKWLRRGKG